MLRRGLVTPAAVRTFAAVWLAFAAALVGLGLWLNPGGILPWCLVAAGAVVAVPSARLAAAPLLFDHARHR
jgi:hypothetical protein